VTRIDLPEAGYYRVRLIRGGIHVGVRVWFGNPVIDGEEQDRSPRWCVEVDGKTTRPVVDKDGNKIEGHVEPLDVFDVWPFCERITEREFRFLVDRRVWAQRHATEHPAAQSRKPIDLRRLPPAW
jgi:hypothetical protein